MEWQLFPLSLLSNISTIRHHSKCTYKAQSLVTINHLLGPTLPETELDEDDWFVAGTGSNKAV